MIKSAAQLRAAQPADAAAVAEVWLAAYDAALPTVQRAHSDNEVRDWVRDVLIPSGHTTVATVGDQVVAMLVLDGGEVEQLYVHPSWWRRGIGTALLREAQRLRPDGLSLWTFQVNAAARAFYAQHGFREILQTDGRDNEEHEPDVRLTWKPT